MNTMTKSKKYELGSKIPRSTIKSTFKQNTFEDTSAMDVSEYAEDIITGRKELTWN